VFTAFALIIFHAYILPVVQKASNRRFDVLKVLVGIPQDSIMNTILVKYDESEIYDLDDEQEAKSALGKRKARKTTEKVVIKKEMNVKLYLLMAALFASITITEIFYQVYSFVQAPQDLVVYETMKSMV
jgi:hypothetical protein